MFGPPGPVPYQPWPAEALEGLSLPLPLALTILLRLGDFHTEPDWQLPGSLEQ